MEILLDNPLANMYGPYFLLLYGVSIVSAVITLAIVKRLLDRTNKLPNPSIPPKIDPYEIAYLRGGINELARSIVFSLIQKNLLEFSTVGKNTQIAQSKNAINSYSLNNIEKITYEWFGKSRQIGDIFQTSGLNSQLAAYAEQYKRKLENQQLLTDSTLNGSFSIFKWLAAFTIAALGFYKSVAAISHGRYNILFLLLFGVVGVIWTAFAKMPRLTKLGKAYLARLQFAFENIKNQAQNVYKQNQAAAANATFAGVDPLLLSVGVFGGGILAGTMFDGFHQTFKKSEQLSSSGSCGGGCGSCSSGSSCGGGSSCSSGCGSGCGGGCGGCGG